jgi:hypothetical protein
MALEICQWKDRSESIAQRYCKVVFSPREGQGLPTDVNLIQYLRTVIRGYDIHSILK